MEKYLKLYENTNDSLIAEEVKEERTIMVFLTPYKLSVKRNFRCPNCGKLLFKYESEIAMMIDREVAPEGKAGSEHYCTRCTATVKVIMLE